MANPRHGPLDSPVSQTSLLEPQAQQEHNLTPDFDGAAQQQRHQSGHDQYQGQDRHSPSLTGAAVGRFEQELGFNSVHPSHSPFPPPFMHPNMIHLMQQSHLHQQRMFHQQQQQAFRHTQEPGSSEIGQEQNALVQSENPLDEQGQNSLQGVASTVGREGNLGNLQEAEDRHRSPHGRPSSIDSPQMRQGSHHPMAQHHAPMFNMPGGPAPPVFDNEFGGPAMVQAHNHFMHMSRMTPPPGFGHFPMHPLQGPQFQTPFQQQQFFMHQQMLLQQQMQQIHQFQQTSPHPMQNQEDSGRFPQDGSPRQNSTMANEQVQPGVAQQDQIKSIESQINQLLFKGDSAEGATQNHGTDNITGKSNRPLSGLTVQEIEEAQVKNLQSQLRRISLDDPVSPPQTRPTTTNVDHSSGTMSNADSGATSTQRMSSDRQPSNTLNSRFQNPTSDSTANRYEQTAEKAPFSVKDIDFYSDRKYDPYRPSSHVFDLITRDARILCQELNPKPEEETRKLALLQRLSDIANEVFGQAEVLPFGSSGNGLALANADMDVCVFLNSQQRAEEVSPVEFVERIGDRLEKDNEFENILQLKRARVPIVKLNHINGIACDIGYQNDLAIWNTRLLRAYCRIDTRVRDVVVVIKKWAKCRKINNPYTGSLSSYAYVLLVIHVLQRQGVLPNLQSIVAGNGKIPYWDCQGFNRYFFEDIPNLARYWQPTPEATRQSVGELLYEFFRYFASEFRYASHVVSIRSGGLLTKEAKEWTKDYTHPHPQHPQPQAPADDAPQSEEQIQADTKPVVKNRYLFCIEDPFELNHNIGRPVDRYSLFTIRGEFMRAAKILSKNGDGAITRLCYEREVPAHQERNRNSSIDHGDDQSRDRRSHLSEKHDTPSLGSGVTPQFDSRRSSGSGNTMAFPSGEDKLHSSDSHMQSRTKIQGQLDNNIGATSVTASNEQGPRQRVGRRSFYKRATIASEPRHSNRA
ncbi:hypothetical protein BGX26_000886 [Mortierella sp. AD094]|nr:hypothetical protein BGX26_000886 [Mortierella sp. AD094]